jgi:hypothetical protein
MRAREGKYEKVYLKKVLVRDPEELKPFRHKVNVFEDPKPPAKKPAKWGTIFKRQMTGKYWAEKGGELSMLQISGVENIVLPQVNQIVVSNIVALGKAAADQPYQRELVILTEQGMLKITLIATDRETLAFTEG